MIQVKGASVPRSLTPTQLYSQLFSVQLDIQEIKNSLFVVSKEPPERPRDYMIRFADGTNWNPGAGAGLYFYKGGVWWDLSKLIIGGIGVVGTFTSNSPTSGKVAWSGVKIYYNGTVYTITNGSTAAATTTIPRLITWTVGNSTLTDQASFSPASNVFLIATNDGGTADLAWNKLAKVGVQETNILGGLLVGIQIQPFGSVTRSLTTTGTTNLLTVSSAAGGLLVIAVRLPSAISHHPQIHLAYSVDGQSAQSIHVYDTSTGGYGTGNAATPAGGPTTTLNWQTGDKFDVNWPNGTTINWNSTNYTIASVQSDTQLTTTTNMPGSTAATYTVDPTVAFDPKAKALSSQSSGTGGGAGDLLNFYLGIGFRSSVTVDIVCDRKIDAGSIQAFVEYGLKT